MNTLKTNPSNSLRKFKVDIFEIFEYLMVIEKYELVNYIAHSRLKLTDKEKESLMFLKKFERKNSFTNSLLIKLVSAIEVYLQDRLIEELKSNPGKIETLILNYKWTRKFSAQDVINGPIELVEEIMRTVVFHKLEKVNQLYFTTLGFNILDLMKDNYIRNAIKIRHKLTHRAGRHEDGEKMYYVTINLLISTMNSVANWIENIDYYYRTNKTKNNTTNFFSRYQKSHRDLESIFKSEMKQIGHLHLSRSLYFTDKKDDNVINLL